MRWFRRDEPDDDARAADPSAGTTPDAHAPGDADDRPVTAVPSAPVPSGESDRDDHGPAAVPVHAPRPDGGVAPVHAAGVIRPVTIERVQRRLRQQGYRYQVDPDGSLSGNWDGNVFGIDLIGTPPTVLQVRGTWSRALDTDLAPGVAQVVNDWNRDRIWPKVYTRTVGERIRIHTEVSVDLGPGATEAQVEEVLACGLGTGVQFFTQLSALVDVTDAAGPDQP